MWRRTVHELRKRSECNGPCPFETGFVGHCLAEHLYDQRRYGIDDTGRQNISCAIARPSSSQRPPASTPTFNASYPPITQQPARTPDRFLSRDDPELFELGRREQPGLVADDHHPTVSLCVFCSAPIVGEPGPLVCEVHFVRSLTWRRDLNGDRPGGRLLRSRWCPPRIPSSLLRR
jgi:hypothetical protein